MECQMKSVRRGRNVISGFTLIELLVVIAVIAVLLSILLPSVRKVSEIARQTVCTSNMRQLGVLCYIYSNDNDQMIVPSARNSDDQLRYPGNSDQDLGGPPWYELLKRIGGLEYSKENAMVLHCPGDKRDKGYCSYSGNRYVMGFSGPRSATEKQYPIQKITTINKSLDNIIMIGERGCLIEGDMGKVDGERSMVGVGVEKFLGATESYTFGNIGFYPGRHNQFHIIEGESASAEKSAVLKMGFLLLDGHAEVYKGNVTCKGSDVAGGDITVWESDVISADDSPGGVWPKMKINGKHSD